MSVSPCLIPLHPLHGMPDNPIASVAYQWDVAARLAAQAARCIGRWLPIADAGPWLLAGSRFADGLMILGPSLVSWPLLRPPSILLGFRWMIRPVWTYPIAVEMAGRGCRRCRRTNCRWPRIPSSWPMIGSSDTMDGRKRSSRRWAHFLHGASAVNRSVWTLPSARVERSRRRSIRRNGSRSRGTCEHPPGDGIGRPCRRSRSFFCACAARPIAPTGPRWNTARESLISLTPSAHRRRQLPRRRRPKTIRIASTWIAWHHYRAADRTHAGPRRGRCPQCVRGGLGSGPGDKKRY